MDTHPATKQRPAMLAFAAALDCRDTALRRDECGDWRLSGRRGCVYSVPEGYLLVVDTELLRVWHNAKRDLGTFAEVRQDGDLDGTMLMSRLPTPAEAEVIRGTLDIFKKRTVSPEHIQRMREGLLEAREAA